jgi:hypothetical protein
MKNIAGKSDNIYCAEWKKNGEEAIVRINSKDNLLDNLFLKRKYSSIIVPMKKR